LSDGVPNRGAALADDLRAVVRRHRPSISFSSLGYGIDHAEDVLAAVGDAGGGGYAFVPDPATCARAFARALGAQADVVADSLELVVTPAEGVTLARLVGREDARYTREGLVLALGDMVPGTCRVVAMEIALALPGDARFLAPVASVELRYREPSATGGAE